MKLDIDPEKQLLPSGYPVSDGAVAWLKRDDKLLSKESMDALRNFFGAFMSFGTMILVIVKWFKGPPAQVSKDQDEEFKAYIKDVVEIENEIARAESAGTLAAADRRKLKSKIVKGLIQVAG